MAATSTALFVLYMLFAGYEEQANMYLGGGGGDEDFSHLPAIHSMESHEHVDSSMEHEYRHLLGSSELNRNVGIINGEEAKQGEFPSQLLLVQEDFWNFTCGAFIVNERYAVSSAHCTYRLTQSGQTRFEYKLLAGTIYRARGGKSYKVSEIKYHPSFNIQHKYNDVSLLKVEEPFKYNRYVQPAKLADKDFVIPPGSMVTVTGWGSDKPEGRPSEVLKKAVVRVIDQDECKSVFERRHYSIVSSQVCALGRGKGQCNGDAGGPLFLNNVVVGVTSFAPNCGDFFLPEIFGRVSHFADWISKNSHD